MSNSLNSTGLTIGTLNGKIKEIWDSTTNKAGVLRLTAVGGTVNTPDSPTSIDASSASAFTLPSIGINSIGYVKYSVGWTIDRKTISVSLPAGGSYVWSNSTGTVDSTGTISSINLLSGKRASGGTKLGDYTVKSTLTGGGYIHQYFAYYRYD